MDAEPDAEPEAEPVSVDEAAAAAAPEAEPNAEASDAAESVAPGPVCAEIVPCDAHPAAANATSPAASRTRTGMRVRR